MLQEGQLTEMYFSGNGACNRCNCVRGMNSRALWKDVKESGGSLPVLFVQKRLKFRPYHLSCCWDAMLPVKRHESLLVRV